MLETANAIYLHIPKTAGTWIRAVLDPIKINWVNHGIPIQPTGKPTFAFIRDPWDWHVSYYHFLQQGSDTYQHVHTNSAGSPQIQALPKNHTFSDFIKATCLSDTDYKSRVLSIYRVRSKVFKINNGPLSNEGTILSTWQDTEDSFYQHVCNTYTRFATDTINQDDIRSKLLLLAESVGDLTEEVRNNIRNMIPINVTNIKQNRRSFYTEETAELVRKACSQIIDKHNFKF